MRALTRLLTVAFAVTMFLGAMAWMDKAFGHHQQSHEWITPETEFRGRTIMCNTQEQIHDILVAQMESFEAARDVYIGYYHTIDKYKQPTCLYTTYQGMIAIQRVARYEGVVLPDGSTTTGYVVEIYYKEHPEDHFFIISRIDVEKTGRGA